MLEDGGEFALIEPEPVSVATFVVGDGLRAAGSCFAHFPGANGAGSERLLVIFVEGARTHKAVALGPVAEEQLEFSGIEPYAVAGDAIIDLDRLVLEDDHRFFACGTFHACIVERRGGVVKARPGRGMEGIIWTNLVGMVCWIGDEDEL